MRGFTDMRALAITICWAGLLAAVGSTELLLFLAPALLIVVPLLFGVYVGEELIVRLAERRGRPRRRPAAVSFRALPSTPAGLRPRGASLIAFSMAKRPPPARLLPQN